MNPTLKMWMIAVLVAVLSVSAASATERFFTYTYEPEVLPQGAAEFEQWITLGTQRNDQVGQHNYNRWDFREELEYGVTDNYSLSLYLNAKSESYQDPVTGNSSSSFDFDGISLENRYMLLNPAEHVIGLTLYLEPRYSGEEAELEEKIIIGQRFGDWKWALNIGHATEWNLNDHATEGELELDFGLTRRLNNRWSLGIELRDHNELPEYSEWENTALFVGPVATYTQEKWWATLSILPQVYGKNFNGDPDGNSGLELEGHERLNVRLVIGIGL
jgi:hypothetical protein